MASFEKTTVIFLQKIIYTKVMKFVLGCIPTFDVKISGMKTNVDESTSIPVWNFSICVPFKTLIKNINIYCHRDTRKKRYGIQSRRKKSSISCCLYDTSNAEKNRTHRYKVIKMFESSFKPVTVKLMKSNVSVISFMMFYENRKIIMYKFIEYFIYNKI